MNEEDATIGWKLWIRWLIATEVGWIVGVLGAIILSSLVVNIFYPKETNLIVGLCMGASIGVFQRIAVRPWLKLSMSWVWGAAVMIAPPFILVVLFEELRFDMSTLPVQVVFGAITLSGGVIGAFLQARELRPHTPHPNWWVGAIAFSWGLAVASDRIIGFMGAGVVLAAVSGGLLIWLLQANAQATVGAT